MPITLDKAIEIAEDIIHYVEPGDPPEEHDAINLLIEAGKVVQALRNQEKVPIWKLLPGETAES